MALTEAWLVRTLNQLRKSLGDTRLKAIQRGRQLWTSALPHMEALITSRSASTAASSEPGLEIGSFVDSGDDFANNYQIISTTGSWLGDFEVRESIGVTTNMAGAALLSSSAAVPPTGVPLPLTPGTIQTSGVQMIDLLQTTPSVVGSTEGLACG